MTHTAKVFMSGNSQAVRLPKEFRLDAEEVEITREGDALILRPKADKALHWAGLRAAAARGFSEDFMRDGRGQPGGQDRPGLDEAFR